MEQITVRLDPDVIAELDEEAEDRNESRAEYVRHVIDSRHEVEELQTEVDELQTEVDRLQRELQAANRRVDEHQELVRYVEEERSLQERREQRQRERERAGILTRSKWWLFGRGVETGRDDSG